MKLLSPLTLFRQTLKLYNATDSLHFLEAATRIGEPGKLCLPKDLVHLGLKMHLRGLLNTLAVQSNRDWVWPYWIERQFNPRDKSFVPRSHALAHMNLTHRNWTILGVLGNSHRCIVDPRGLVTPWMDGWSLDFWLTTESGFHCPSRWPHAKQKIDSRYPILKTDFKGPALTVKSRVFAESANQKQLVFVRVRVLNLGSKPVAGHFYFSIRPYNPEGISLIRELEFVKDHLWRVNGLIGAFLPEVPDRTFCSNLQNGDVSLFLRSGQARQRVTCAVGLATGLAQYELKLAPAEKRDFQAILTLQPANSPRDLDSEPSSFHLQYRNVRHQFRRHWQKRLSQGARFGFPDKKITASFQANKTHLQIFDRGNIMTPGVLTYSHSWIRDAAFMVHALDKLGFHTQAEEKLAYFPTRQDAEGYFAFQEGEWDSNGLAIWCMLEHFKLTRDTELLGYLYGSIRRGADWIIRKRQQTQRKLSPHQGLLPPGISAEHLGPRDYYYWDNFWSVAGLRGAAQAAQALGQSQDAKRYTAEALQFWDDLEKSLARSQKRSGLRILPASPNRRLDSGAIGSLCAVYPLGLIPASEPTVLNTLNLLDRAFVMDEGFFQDHFHSGVNCYLSAHLAQCYLALGKQRAWKIVRYLLKHATGTFAWPEAFHPRTKGGCMGEGHHGWAAAEWILLLRNLLFFEKGEDLWLLPVLEPSALQRGDTFSARSAPSYFGTVNFKLFADRQDLLLELANDFSISRPRHLIWQLPFKPSKVTVDGQAQAAASTRLLLNPDVCRVLVLR